MQKTLINKKWELSLPEHRAARDVWDTWEFERLQSMHSHLKPKDRVVYVGAEEGDLAALCALWGCEMVLIEPNEKVWPNIRVIWEVNNFSQPEIFVGFASDVTTGETVFHFPDSAYGEVIGDHGFKTLKEYPELPTIRIDDIAGKIDAISIDVEGAECKVIDGAIETLKTRRPKVWLSLHPEFMFEQYGIYSNDLRKKIRDLAYRETLLDYQHEVHLYYEPL
jgi:FkbM family methyltransferase